MAGNDRHNATGIRGSAPSSLRPRLGHWALVIAWSLGLGHWTFEAQAQSFPLKISENKRHLVDSTGKPFLYHADTAWMLLLKLREDEAFEYLADRKAKGFNVVQIQLTGFLGMKTVDGKLPFEDNDFSRPNPQFFDHADVVISKAAEMGLLMAVAPAWVGCCGEGWGGRDKEGRDKPLGANGPEKSRRLGRYLGNRYKQHPNLLWILGGDNDPGRDRDEIAELGRGIKEAAPGQLVTYHAASSHSSTDIYRGGDKDSDWLDVSMVYTYFRGFNKAWNKNQPDVYEVSHAEWKKTPVKPFFLGESTYEGEHGDWGSALQARKQAYWAVLGGGTGHAYGSPNWNFPANWREVMNLPGAASLKHLRTLFESRPWHTLVPDIDNTVAVDGRGPFATKDYATTALAADKSFSISYLPTKRKITLDLGKLAGEQVKAWWFNPRTGEATSIGTFATPAVREFEPDGEGDWVLVLDDVSKDFGRPGKR